MNLRRTTWALAGALLTTLALPASGMAVTGDVTEFPIKTPNSMPFGITAGPDGNVWFTESAGNNVGRITPDGTITEYPVTGAMGLYDITLGPDGKSLWMTDQTANKVFQVVPDLSDPTKKPTITPGSATLTAPRAIAAINGELWVGNQGGTVQRVKADGSADGLPIPTTATNIQFGAKGPDNNFWVSDLNGGLVKVTTGATPTASAVNIGANKAPRGVVSAPDGKVYFTETDATNGEMIGRINTDGTGLQETPKLSGGASDPEGMSVGRDGNIYVAIFNGAQIGQVTPSLGLTQFKKGVSGTMGPRSITQGADGNEWYTNETSNAIGRFTVDAPPPPPGGGGGGGGGTPGGGGGGGATNGATPVTPVNNAGTPQVSEVAVKPSRFRVGARATAVSAKTGTTITFLLTKDATATLSFDQAVQGRRRGSGCVRINRRNINGRKCTRFIPRGTLTRAALQGLNAVPFTGRIGRRALKPGRYRVGVDGTDAEGRTGLFQYATFIVLPPRQKATRRGR